MTVTQTLLRQEWRALRIPFIGVTIMHLLVIVTLVEWRDGKTHAPELLWAPILFAAGIVVDRVYLEHQRGTWLLLPISRANQASSKLTFHAFLIFAHLLVGALTYYGLIRASDAPGQPLPSLAEFVGGQLAWQFSIAFSVLALGWVASMQEKKWLGALWLASAAVLAVGINQLVHVSSFASISIPLDVTSRYTLVAVVMAVLGQAFVRQESRSIGRVVPLPLLGLRALGLTPLTMLILWSAILPFNLVEKMSHVGYASARSYDETHMLADGEIVVLHVEENVGKTGHRRNGEALFFPSPARKQDTGIVRWSSLTRPAHDTPGSFYQSIQGDGWYLSRDQRRVLFFDHHSHTSGFGRQIGCWGADGISHSVECTPFPEAVISLSKIYSRSATTGEDEPVGERLVTSERVVDRDLHGEVHERFRGRGIESTVFLDNDQMLIFTHDHTYLVGSISRTYPVIPRGQAELLPDGTLVVLQTEDLPFDSVLDFVDSHFVTFEPHTKEFVTFYGPGGEVREEAWPHTSSYQYYQFNLYKKDYARTCVMFPFPTNPFGPDLFPWMLVPIVALRLMGALAMILAWRRRGLLLALPGLVLGPAYFLAAAFVLADVPALVERVRRRIISYAHVSD